MNRDRDVFQDATGITLPLVKSLAKLEVQHRGAIHTQMLEVAIEVTWRVVIEDARTRNVSLQPTYLLSLAAKLNQMEYANGDREELFPSNWASFLAELSDGSSETIQGSEAWVLAQIVWGTRMHSMSFSLGWLVLNGLRLQEGMHPFFPTPSQSDRLVAALGEAGPPCWDTESLRALLGEYERS